MRLGHGNVQASVYGVVRKRDQSNGICVLHLITTLDVGGAEMSLLKLVSRMNGGRFRNHVICLAEMGPVGEKLWEHGIPVHALKMPRGLLTIRGLLQLLRLLRRINPDILQTWMYHADLLGVLIGKCFRLAPICWNIRCSNMDLLKYRWATRVAVKLCAILSSLPNVTIVNSKEGANFHKRMGYRAKRWEIISNGFDLGVFRPDGQARERLARELGLNYGEPPVFIGYIARFDPMKDHRTFLDAASRLLRQRIKVHFVLAGRGVDSSNKDIVRKIPGDLIENFHLLGERDDVERITAGLDIACSVSLGEGFPNVIGEAMACGVPCVVTDVGDSAFIVGETGMVVRPRDNEGLMSAWNQLLDLGKEGRAELGKAARERMKACFDIKKVVERYESLYASLLD